MQRRSDEMLLLLIADCMADFHPSAEWTVSGSQQITFLQNKAGKQGATVAGSGSRQGFMGL